jgi:hypothetical protein
MGYLCHTVTKEEFPALNWINVNNFPNSHTLLFCKGFISFMLLFALYLYKVFFYLRLIVSKIGNSVTTVQQLFLCHLPNIELSAPEVMNKTVQVILFRFRIRKLIIVW